MANNYGELFCQAVDTIVKERLSAISYDLTTLCTIVDDSRREEGIYTVSNGSVKFDAYSDNTSYRQGNNVYVIIPEGDWNLTKFITGKKAAKGAEVAYNYRKPFDSLVDVTGNVIYGETKAGLIANAPSKENEYKSAITIWSYNSQNKESFKGYTRLGLQAGFLSWLNPFYDDTRNNESTNIVKGSYGLRLRIYVSPDTIIDNAAESGHYDLYLDAASMNGNPYNFETFFLQEKVFDISQFGEITLMELLFYEEPDTFFNEYGTDLKYKDFLENYIAPNLFCNDVYLCFGYDISDFGDNEVVLYSPNSSTYHPAASAANNRKTVNLRWIHNFGNNNFKVVDDKNISLLEAEYEIRWYKYKLGAKSADIYSGVYWERVNEGGTFLYNFNPDITLAKELIKVIILYQGIPLRSNILVFENENEVVNLPTLDAILAIEIFCEDNSYGNYRIYALGNSLIDSADGPKMRQWHLYFNESDLTEAESIEWIIPYENTMIVMDEDRYSSCKNVTDGNYHIIVNGDANDAYAIINTLNYRIRNYYSLNYNRNTIECIVTKNGIQYYGTKEMTFGIQGTTGTDCTLVLDFDDGITAMTRNNYEKVTVTARLYDCENTEVKDWNGATISWDWFSSSNLIYFPGPTTDKTVELRLYSSNSVSTSNYHILRATVKNWGDYTLEAYLPIPIRESTTYQFISGPTSVYYSSLGLVEEYYSNPYAIYTTSDGLVTANGTWYINKNDNFSPEIRDNRLYPKSVYIEKSNLNLCVYCRIGNTVVWSLPLLIMLNKYPAKILNDWNGLLTIDNSNNSILAAKIAAGTKDSDNKFTGVVLGDWKNGSTDIGIGLYGFDAGEASFGFKENGTAFIGKSDTGRIEFDGSKGIILSAVYDNGSGMSIDLYEGTINAHLFELNAGKDETTPSGEGRNNTIYISTKALTYPLRIGSNFRVDWNGNIYATDAYFEDGYFEGELNATSGKLGSLDIKGTLSGGTLSGTRIEGGTIIGRTAIYVPNDDEPRFSVTANGYLTANEAKITGNINATTLECENGNIGGWNINETSLYKNKTALDSSEGIITNYLYISNNRTTSSSIGRIGYADGMASGYRKTTVFGIVSDTNAIVLDTSSSDIRLTSGESSSLTEWIPGYRSKNIYLLGYEVQTDAVRSVFTKNNETYFDSHDVYFTGTVHFGSAKVEGLSGGSGGVAVFG